MPAIVLIATLAKPSWAGDGIVALQTADPSCGDDSGNTYVNCGNGTVTDNRTGLVWLRNANCYFELDWHDALEIVANLSDLPSSFGPEDDCGLSDGSSPGEWRLPSAAEWSAMVADARLLGCVPTITDDEGSDCWATSVECFVQGRTCSFTDVESAFYWSGTTRGNEPNHAWFWFMEGASGYVAKDSELFAWPVRGGQ